MPTLAQLQSESYWNREIVTTELDWLGDEICRITNRPRTAAGSKGDQFHLKGAHRSQEWILNSIYCTNRTYTVQSGLSIDQSRYIAGFDFVPGIWGTTLNHQLVSQQTARIIEAMKRGLLNEVIEIYGQINGRLTGYHNTHNVEISSDSSHHEHWHLTFDRRQLRNSNAMKRVIGFALGGDDMTPEQAQQLSDVHWTVTKIGDDADGRIALHQWADRTDNIIKAIATDVVALREEIAGLTVGSVDINALAAALAANPAFITGVEVAAIRAIKDAAALVATTEEL